MAGIAVTGNDRVDQATAEIARLRHPRRTGAFQVNPNVARGEWVDNDEGLYNLWQSSGLSKREFVRENGALIDEVINNVKSGDKPAHYLAYGG